MMALQEISLSTATVQAPASSSGAAASGAPAADPAFLLMMRAASQTASARQTASDSQATSAPQIGKTAAQEPGGGEKTAGQPADDADPGDPKTAALPYVASALAALFAAQTVGQNLNAVQAAGQSPDAAGAADPVKTGAAATAQPSMADPAGAALSQGVSGKGTALPAFAAAAGPKAETFSAAAQQLPQTARAASVPQATSTRQASDLDARAAVSTRTGEGPVPAEAFPQAMPAPQTASVPQQIAQSGQAAGEASRRSGTAAETQTFPSAARAAGKIVVLSSDGSSGDARPADGTRSIDTAQAADSIPNGAGPAAPQTRDGAPQQIRTSQQGFVSSTGETGGAGVSRQEDAFAANAGGARQSDGLRPADDPRPGGTSPSVADLYTAGKVVIKVSDQAERTGASPSRQVADAVAEGLKSGIKQLKVDLYPGSLGRVSVKLALKDGLLTVQLAADNAKTQDLLASSSGDIRSMLQNATGQPVQVTRPDQTPAQQWYAQDGGAGGQDRRRQQENDRRAKDTGPSAVGDAGAVSTEDFLTMMRKTVGA